MTRFLTQKPCFNSVNDFPETTFNWYVIFTSHYVFVSICQARKRFNGLKFRVALDGSQVICHMPPCRTYCSEASFGDIKRSISNHKSLDQDNTALVAVSPSISIKITPLLILDSLAKEMVAVVPPGSTWRDSVD